MITVELAEKLSGLPIIDEIRQLNQSIIEFEPIAQEIKDQVFQKLKLDWNYNSNAIEGNKLNYGETVAFLMHGITAKGKTLKDHLDIKGHNDAINFLLSILKEECGITASDIRALHKMILVEEYDADAITVDGKPTKKRIKLGVYKSTPNSVKTRTGEMHYYASVEQTPILMDELMQWYNACKNNPTIHPLVLASLFHFQFVAIHPFDDGNGRLARILMNLILMRNHFLPVVVKNEDKSNYYGVLAQADENQFIPLISYMGELLKHSMQIQLKAIKGENIEEETDIDKEIALLKMSLSKENLPKKGRTHNMIELSIDDSILPLLTQLHNKLKDFEGLFYSLTYNIFTNNYEKGTNEIELKFVPLFIIENTKQNKYKYIFQINLKNLKNTNDKVDIYRNIELEFEEKSIIINVMHKNISVIAYYNKPLSQEEINNFVNTIMKDIINEIKQHTQPPSI